MATRNASLWFAAFVAVALLSGRTLAQTTTLMQSGGALSASLAPSPLQFTNGPAVLDVPSTKGPVQFADSNGAVPPDTPSTVELSIAPRFWYLFSSGGFAKPTNSLALSSSAQFELPMAGATASARFLSLPDTNFLLTFLYGQGTVTANSFCASCYGYNALGSADSLTNNRYDTEFLAQTAFPNSPAAWIIGVRWEHEDLHGTATQTIVPAVGPVTFATFPQTSRSDFVTLKSGLAGAVPISSTGDLRLFGNIMLLAGAADTTNGTYGLVGPDMSVGVQYVLAANVVADLRYRAVVDFFFDAPSGTAKYGITQGPMIGVNFKF